MKQESDPDSPSATPEPAVTDRRAPEEAPGVLSASRLLSERSAPDTAQASSARARLPPLVPGPVRDLSLRPRLLTPKSELGIPTTALFQHPGLSTANPAGLKDGR